MRQLGHQGIESFLYVTRTHIPAFEVDARLLKQAYYASIGHALIREQQLCTLLPLLQDVPHALLKGVALAYTIYPEPATREMSDIDVWVPFEAWHTLVSRLETQGYRAVPSPTTPPALLRLYGGELKLAPPSEELLPIELHWPLARGEWVQLTTAIDFETIWRRRQHISILGYPVTILAFEDMLLYAAIHFAINHRLGHFGLRGLLDIHALALYASLDWDEIVRNARRWRLRTMLWLVLSLTVHFFGTPIPEHVLGQLRPTYWRRAMLKRLQTDEAVVNTSRYSPFCRFVLLYLLVDRPRDVFRFLWRTIWPEKQWAMARYGQRTWRGIWRARLEHFWDLATNRERL